MVAERLAIFVGSVGQLLGGEVGNGRDGHGSTVPELRLRLQVSRYNLPMAFVVNDEHKSMEAHAALRDVLYLFYDLTKYQGFSGDHDTGSFDAWRYVNCEVFGGWLDPDDLALLHEGSAAALLSNLIDIWDQGDGDRASLGEYTSMLDAGRLQHLPEAEFAARQGLEGEDALMRELPRVYDAYVLDRLRALHEGGRRTGADE